MADPQSKPGGKSTPFKTKTPSPQSTPNTSNPLAKSSSFSKGKKSSGGGKSTPQSTPTTSTPFGTPNPISNAQVQANQAQRAAQLNTQRGGSSVSIGVPVSSLSQQEQATLRSQLVQQNPTIKEQDFQKSKVVVRSGQTYIESSEVKKESPPITKPQGVVSAVERPTGLLGLRFDLTQIQSQVETQSYRGGVDFFSRVKSFGTGLGIGFLDQALGVKALVTNPIETIKNIPMGIKSEGLFVGGGLASRTPETAIGRLTSFYVGSKGITYAGKGVVNVVDLTRTRNAIKIDAVDVIAPEYFKGQTYPAIQRGQTAGQLLTEFPTREIYGVTQLRGFTASPKPISAGKGILPGTSELPGLYQAPKVSPQFLRVTQGEKAVFSFNPFGTLRPSISIVKPTAFELTPFVSYSQTGLAKLNLAKRFFTTTAQPGKSYIPFIKTEKEAIIPAGSSLTLTGKPRFYTTFEGRRIPIFEFEAGTGGQLSKVYTPAEVSKLSSYKVGSKGVTSPYDFIKVSRSSSSYVPNKVSYSLTPSYSGSNYSISSLTSSIKPSVSKGRSSSRGSTSFSLRSLTPSSSVIPSISRPPKSPPIYSYRVGSSYRPPRVSMNIRTPSYSLKLPKLKRYYKKEQQGLFSVLVRRFGKWKIYGYGKTPMEAVGIGKEYSEKSLGRSFTVPGLKPSQVLPGFRTKQEKIGQVFIQKTKYEGGSTLASSGEKAEIKMFRMLQGGRR